MEINNNDSSRWSEGQMQIQRLSQLWSSLNFAYLNGNLGAMCSTLDVIYLELYSDGISKNKTVPDKVKSLNHAINISANEMRKAQHAIEDINYCSPRGLESELKQTMNRARSLYVTAIMAKAFWLKNLQNLCGKGSTGIKYGR